MSDLAKAFKYKPLPGILSTICKTIYESHIPEWLNLNGDSVELKTSSGTVICNGYNRIVIGDYGAFIEFTKEQAIRENLRIAPGQEYRVNDPKYKDSVAYVWHTARDDSQIKIYRQKKTVDYADYKIGMCYVSVVEVIR